MSEEARKDRQDDGDGSSAEDMEEGAGGDGVEVVTLSDELGRGVYLTCAAELAPADLIEGLLDLLGQVTRAALARPEAGGARDLGLGEDVF